VGKVTASQLAPLIEEPPEKSKQGEKQNLKQGIMKVLNLGEDVTHQCGLFGLPVLLLFPLMTSCPAFPSYLLKGAACSVF
jgi:hypothetical protein